MRKRLILAVTAAACLLCGCVSNVKEGVSLLEEGRYEAALEAFQLEIDENKNLDEANRGMAIAYYELENYEEALSCFNKALENGAEETATIFHLMGTCCIQMKDYEGTVTYYEKAIVMEDCSESMRQEMMFNKIAIYEEQKDWDAAKEAVKAYLMLYPDDERAVRESEFLETR